MWRSSLARLAMLGFALANGQENWIDTVVPPLHDSSEYPAPFKAWDNLQPAWHSMHEIHNTSGSGNGLPFLACHYKPNLTMSDGIFIRTLVVNPWPCDKKKGTVLVRSPYGPTTQNLARVFLTLNKYVVVMQDQRGTWKSKGKFDLFRHDGQDGHETFNWIRSQPWSNGDVYTAGISADGISSYTPSIFSNTPVKASWAMWTTSNGHEFVYPQGAYRVDLMEGYLNLLALVSNGQSKDLIPVMKQNENFGPWWYNLTDITNFSKPAAPPGNFLKNIHWPMVLSVGWWDIFQGPSIRAVQGIYDRRLGDPSVRDKHVVIVDPLGHCLIGVTGGFAHSNYHRETINGIVVAAELASEFFNGNTNGPMRSRIGRLNYFIMTDFGGDARHTPGNYWTSLEDYPPSTTKTLYMQPESTMSDFPATSASSAAYTYDPSTKAGLTPMKGGNNLPIVGHIFECGSVDQSKREQRDDVVVFDSGVLSDDLPVVGQIFATLFVSSSAKDTDFVVTISDLGPRKSMLVRYGALRMRWREGGAKGDYLQPLGPLVNGTVYEVEINLDSTAYVFPKGHKIRVSVSSAASPYYHANPNTGAPESASISPSKFEPVAARNAVHFAPEYPSKISLPIVKLEDIPRNPNFAPRIPLPKATTELIV